MRADSLLMEAISPSGYNTMHLSPLHIAAVMARVGYCCITFTPSSCRGVQTKIIRFIENVEIFLKTLIVVKFMFKVLYDNFKMYTCILII